MQPRKLEGIGDLVGPLRVQITETTSSENHDEVVATIATVVIVGIGAAVFEAALLPGIALGVAAMWLPRYYPTTGEAFEPLFKSSVGDIKAANAAVNMIDLATRAARLGLRVSRRR